MQSIANLLIIIALNAIVVDSAPFFGLFGRKNSFSSGSNGTPSLFRSKETNKILEKIHCRATLQLAKKCGAKFKKRTEENALGTNDSLKTEDVTLGWKKSANGKWEKTSVEEERVGINLDIWDPTILIEDDLTDNELKGFNRFFLSILSNPILYPLKDIVFPFADDSQAKRYFTDLLLSPGAGYPVSYNTDFNMQTDESFSRIFFEGIGAPLMMDHSKDVSYSDLLKYGPFMLDLDFAADLKVRDSKIFRKYGAKIHFDKNKAVSAIYDSEAQKYVLPGDPDWEVAKMQAKVTVVSICTIREHLCQTHFMVANVSSRETVKNLHPAHPIRRLLTIFNYNNVSVNQQAAKLLFPNRSSIHRSMPLDYEEGVTPLFRNAVTESIAFQPFPDRKIRSSAIKKLTKIISKEGSSEFPYYNEGCEYFEIVRKMVCEWLNEAPNNESYDDRAKAFYNAVKHTTIHQKYTLPEYTPANLENMITTIIWTVTFYHELLGHLSDYFNSPLKAGFRLTKENPTSIDVQSLSIAVVIVGSTSIPAPQLMAEFPKYIGAGGAPAWERDVWTRFLCKIGLQSKKIQERNVMRGVEYKYSNPSYYECSVAV